MTFSCSSRPFLQKLFRPLCLPLVRLASSSSIEPVSLTYDDYNTRSSSSPPIVISHGLLGSRSNWTSLAKQIHKTTGRRVVTVDARNHGDSPHSESMCYPSMAADLTRLIGDLGLGKVTLVGHSMGGRTTMYMALSQLLEIDKVVVVDISPINKTVHLTSKEESNVEHYFRSLKAVSFAQNLPISQARQDADRQLAKRINLPGMRAWLLMNMKQDPNTKEIRWGINLDGIHNFFKESIAFPDMSGTSWEGPTLFLGGGQSDYISLADHEEIKKQFPVAEFQYVAEAGHWVHSEKPKEFLEKIVKFI